MTAPSTLPQLEPAAPAAALLARLRLVERAIRALNWKVVAGEHQQLLHDELVAFQATLRGLPPSSKLVTGTAKVLAYAKRPWHARNAEGIAAAIDVLMVEIQWRWPTRPGGTA